MRKLSMLFAGVLIAGALIIGIGAGGFSPSTFITHVSQLVNDSGFLTDAPSDGSDYARNNGAWAVVTSGGGGSITSVIRRIYADSQSAMFPAQPNYGLYTNGNIATTHSLAEFTKNERLLLGGDTLTLPNNINSNAVFSVDYYTLGSTNLTVDFIAWYSDGNAAWTATNRVTIPESSITNRASWTFNWTLTNAVAGNRIWWTVGCADTNTGGATRDGTIVSEMAECEFVTE